MNKYIYTPILIDALISWRYIHICVCVCVYVYIYIYEGVEVIYWMTMYSS